jgi:hypothetical protein
MIAACIAAAKKVMPVTVNETQARMPFRSKHQQVLLRIRSRMEAALREVIAKSGLSMLQLTCMHDLGITAPLNLSLQDKELLIDTPQWKTLLKAEIQSSKNQLDPWPTNRHGNTRNRPREKKRESICATRKGLVNSVETRTPHKHPKNWC